MNNAPSLGELAFSTSNSLSTKVRELELRIKLIEDFLKN